MQRGLYVNLDTGHWMTIQEAMNKSFIKVQLRSFQTPNTIRINDKRINDTRNRENKFDQGTLTHI